MNFIKGYIGTYHSPQSKGLYEFYFHPESGELTRPKLFLEAKNAKCASLYGNTLAAPLECDDGCGVCMTDIHTLCKPTYHLLEEKNTSCYITQDDTYIYTANYHEGHVLIYRKQSGRLELTKNIPVAPFAGCHQVLLYGNYLLVPCLELDMIYIYDCCAGFSLAGEIPFPKGSGPRHGVFHPDGTLFYVVCERSNEVFTFQVESDCHFQLKHRISTLPNPGNGESTSSAIRLTKDGRFLCVSVRGADLITVYSLSEGIPSPLQYASCQGQHPRDFILSPDERFLLCANRFSNEIVSIPRSPHTGLLGSSCSRITVHEGVGILLE